VSTHPELDKLDPAFLAAIQDSAEDLYEEAPCGYLSTTPDGMIARINSTFLRWIGYSRDDLVGVRRLQDLLSPGARIYHETHYAPMLRMQGFVREIAVEFVRADGSRLPALLNSALRTGPAGAPIAVRTTIFDATERRRYEQQLLAERNRARESEARAQLLARTLQESLIPPAPSHVAGFDVSAVYRPAGDGMTVGGDFYDVFASLSGQHVITIGDVSGKGVEAARVTAATRYAVRTAAMNSDRPDDILRAVNEVLLSQRFDRYCTTLCARIRVDGTAAEVDTASAGHPLPLLVSADGAITALGQPGPPLGVFEDARAPMFTTALSKGDSIVLYTDGVTEGRDPQRAWFGEDRLNDFLSSHAGQSSARITKGLLESVLEFQQGEPRDDIAILVLRRT
jgi:phosphoserine phosphatase RsbU/P